MSSRPSLHGIRTALNVDRGLELLAATRDDWNTPAEPDIPGSEEAAAAP